MSGLVKSVKKIFGGGSSKSSSSPARAPVVQPPPPAVEDVIPQVPLKRIVDSPKRKLGKGRLDTILNGADGI